MQDGETHDPLGGEDGAVRAGHRRQREQLKDECAPRAKRGRPAETGGEEEPNEEEEEEQTADSHGRSETEHDNEVRYREYLKRVKLGYKVQDPELLDLSKWGFAPSFASMFGHKPDDLSIDDKIFHAGDGIYLMEIFTPEFCQQLVREVEHFEAWCAREKIDILRPNSMNHYGVILDHIAGMDAVLQQFVCQLIEPLSRKLFPHLHPVVDGQVSALDSHHGFVVEYGAEKDKKLDWHVDESEVTLNVCLGKSFTGGDLVFSGVRGEMHRRDTPPLTSKGENVRVAHLVGHGLLHVGKHRHAALPIQSGERTNLIIWCNNSKFQEGHGSCSSWCGWNKLAS